MKGGPAALPQKGSRATRQCKADRAGALSALLVVTVLLSSGCLEQAPSTPMRKFKGTPYTPPEPAPDFNLTTQFGTNGSMSGFRGKVIVLTFLFTACVDACPMIVVKLKTAAGELGGAVGPKVAFAAVTVDPERDTVGKVKSYSDGYGMTDKWLFFTGAKSDLAPVWKAYGVHVNASAHNVSENYDVDHSTLVFVIDGRGDLRLLYGAMQMETADLVHDVRLLIAG